MRNRYLQIIVSVILGFCANLFVRNCRAQAPATVPSSATVPLVFEDNRVFVDLSFRRPDGSIRKARAWVDTGGGWFAMTQRLAEDLALSHTGEEIKSEGQRAVLVKAPTVLLGAIPLDLSTVSTFEVLDVTRIDPGIDAEAFLPARVLMHYDAVFDYPAREFTLGLPGVLKPRGTRVPSPIDAKTGFPRIELAIDEQLYGFLLDTGAAYTMISRELLDKWATQHTNWPRLDGAVGEANMIGSEFDTGALVLRIPSIRCGDLQIHNVGVTSRRVGIFETSMSKYMTAPIVGAVAGNLLKNFRVQINFAENATYLEQRLQPDPNDLDSVGIIFQPREDGSYIITGTAQKGGKPVLEAVQAGDHLLAVDGRGVTGTTRDAVIRALAGKPGDQHKLRLERDGKQFEIQATVQHLL